jgi:phosphatidylserine decarboxylase
MKHAGKAQTAALKLIGTSLLLLAAIVGAALIAKFFGNIVLAMTSTLLVIWLIFVGFTLYFFRDPEAKVPAGKGLILSPAHGTVDVIDETTIKEFGGEKCKRISIFLNVFNVHVQQSPVSGKVTYLKHTSGLFLNALKTESAEHNENVMISFEPAGRAGEKIGVRLIAGLIARRIIPWVNVGDDVEGGQRISLIQFGSRVDVYLPPGYQIRAKLGDKTVGGETILAVKE